MLTKYLAVITLSVTVMGSILPQPVMAATHDANSLEQNGGKEAQETGKPIVHYDVTKLPKPVFETRQRIMEAAKSGEIENLRPLLKKNDEETQIRLNEQEGDPISFLTEISGDGEGIEILAILLDLLQSGYVVMNEGNQNELYVWPYFVALPLGSLNKAQMVEAYQIMTVGDFDVMREIGSYTFFRLGIAPDGHWHFFLTGD